MRRRRFIVPILASAVLVLSAPFIGQLRAALQDAFPGQYRAIIATAVFGSIAAAMAFALFRIHLRSPDDSRASVGQVRNRRVFPPSRKASADRHSLGDGGRYGCILAALTIGTIYARLSRTGDPAVDAVERFHFVEYGLIAFLFYRAWRHTNDGSLLILPVFAGVLVGTGEEWLQWFVPARVGEMHDVLLNLWALVCGLLFSLAVDPPDRLTLSLGRESWRRVRRFGAAVLIVFALFFHAVHLGYEVQDSEIGVFRSGYDAETLLALSRERAARWRDRPPLTWSRLSREDQYFSEGLVHVQARNRCWDEGKMGCAWRENLILERYFAPVIDTPSYVSATGLRWHPDQRADAEARGKADSTAVEDGDSIIYAWPKAAFWLVVLAVSGGLVLL
jgi:hypothetical protein